MGMVPDEFEDGTAAFFTNREVAWHKLGVVTPNALTAEDALKTALLEYDLDTVLVRHLMDGPKSVSAH